MKKLFLGINKKYNVSFHLSNPEETYSGELNLANKKLPYIKIDTKNGKKIDYWDGIKEDYKIPKINGKQDKNYFTFFQSELEANIIYPKFVFLGKSAIEDKEIKINKLYFSLANLSGWFAEREKTTVDDEKLVYEIDYKKFEFEIETELYGRIKISNPIILGYKPKKKKNAQIVKIPTIEIECLTTPMNLDLIHSLNYDIQTLLTFIIGFPCKTKYLWCVINDILHSIYFANFYNENNKIIHNSQTLLNFSLLYNENKIEIIFHNYFRQKEFGKRWGGFYSALNYDGIWDYQILGFISSFDYFLSQFVKSREIKLPKNEFRKIRKDFSTSLNVTIYENQDDNKKKKVYESIQKSICSIKNSNLVSFKDKFYCWYSVMDNDIKKIIGFDDLHFEKLKRIRDQIAHGETIDFDSLNHTWINRILFTLVLINFSIIYLELGLTKNDLFHHLFKTMHYIKSNSLINTTYLDRMLGKVDFLKFKKQTFEAICKLRPDGIIFERKQDSDKIKVNLPLTRYYQKNDIKLSNKYEHRHLKDIVEAIYREKKIPIKEVKYRSRLYVEQMNTDLSKKLHSIFEVIF